MRGKNIFAIATIALVFASLLAIPTPVLAQTLPRMYIDPSTVTIDANQMFTVSVWVEDVVDLYAYEFKIGYSYLAFTFIAPPTDNEWLKAPLISTFFAWSGNPQAGIITVGATRLGEVPGKSGTGKLATFTFRTETTGAGTVATLDLCDVRLIDSGLNDMPSETPGDCSITINWPTWLLNVELYLSAEKGGKIWTAWQTGTLEPTPFFDPNSPYYWPDPYWLDYPLMWPTQTIYGRIRNTGIEPAGESHVVYVRVRVKMEDTVTGWVQYTNSKPEKVWAKSDVVSSSNVGPTDLYQGVFVPWEDFQQYPATWLVTGRVQISLNGFDFKDWNQMLINGQYLPGDWYSRDVPGGSTGKFKVLP